VAAVGHRGGERVRDAGAGDLADRVGEAAARSDGDTLATGSARLVQGLPARDLVDALRRSAAVKLLAFRPERSV
jgi:hypothetical protein